MYNLQKPTTINLLLMLVLAAIFCQTIYTQKLRQHTPPLFQECWIYPTNKLTDFKFASDNQQNVYSALLDGKLVSINGISGEKRWEAELGGEILSAPLVEADNVYIAARYTDERVIEGSSGANTLTLRSINKATGVTQWKAAFANGFLSIGKVYLFNFESYLVFVGDNGDVYSIDKMNGRIVWKKSFNTKLSSKPFVKINRLILGTLDNKIIGLSIYDGRLIESLEFPVSLTTIVESTNGNNLILGDGKGLLTSFNKKLRTRNWKFRNGAEISDITFTWKGLLVTSSDNYIYLISEANGKLFWKKRLSGRVSGEPQVYGNYIIIVVNEDSFASVIELDGGKLVNRIALEDNNFFAGDSIRTGNYFIYSTLKGILSFSGGTESCITK